MKKIISMLALTLVFISGAYAQTANEGFVGASFLRENVKFTQINKQFDENTDSFGFVVAGTHFLNKSNFGVTADFGANFDTNQASLVTLTAGVTAKARTFNYVQPFANVLVGVARQNVNRKNVLDTTDISPALVAGGGFDFSAKPKSKYKLRVGADLVVTRFANTQQNALRLSTGLVF